MSPPRSHPLHEYNRKRRFEVTPEPRGRASARRGHGKALAYVIQKHRASHLHYDLRLEHDGVMLSWAVPKGPSLDPAVKRLAMQTEDHPIEYNRFEGVIPEGEYGAGTVMIWDRGTWEPDVDDVGAALARGDLKFIIHGEKLRGSWVLVRTRDRQWLLIKHRDATASAGEDVTVTRPLSVLSRRSLAEIAHAGGASVRQLGHAADADPPEVTAATIARGASKGTIGRGASKGPPNAPRSGRAGFAGPPLGSRAARRSGPPPGSRGPAARGRRAPSRRTRRP
jgi:bifunctional non-homologous end joining protein LigD